MALSIIIILLSNTGFLSLFWNLDFIVLLFKVLDDAFAFSQEFCYDMSNMTNIKCLLLLVRFLHHHCSLNPFNVPVRVTSLFTNSINFKTTSFYEKLAPFQFLILIVFLEVLLLLSELMEIWFSNKSQKLLYITFTC